MIHNGITTRKALIIEDYDKHARLFEALLRKMGFDIIVKLETSELGLQVAASKEKYNVILLDLQMPYLDDGLKILEALRDENSVNCDSQIIVISIRDDEEAVERAKELGCSDYLYKSVTYEELKDSIMAEQSV